MIEIKEKKLATFVDEIRNVLSNEDYKELEQDYSANMDHYVKDGYSPVFIRKYFEEFVFRKITKTNK